MNQLSDLMCLRFRFIVRRRRRRSSLWAWTPIIPRRKLKSWLTHWRSFALTNMYKQFNLQNALEAILKCRSLSRSRRPNCWFNWNLESAPFISSPRSFYIFLFEPFRCANDMPTCMMEHLLLFNLKPERRKERSRRKNGWGKSSKEKQRDLNIFKCHIHVISSSLSCTMRAALIPFSRGIKKPVRRSSTKERREALLISYQSNISKMSLAFFPSSSTSFSPKKKKEKNFTTAFLTIFQISNVQIKAASHPFMLLYLVFVAVVVKLFFSFHFICCCCSFDVFIWMLPSTVSCDDMVGAT